jgi:hypothetical protein
LTSLGCFGSPSLPILQLSHHPRPTLHTVYPHLQKLTARPTPNTYWPQGVLNSSLSLSPTPTKSSEPESKMLQLLRQPYLASQYLPSSNQYGATRASSASTKDLEPMLYGSYLEHVPLLWFTKIWSGRSGTWQQRMKVVSPHEHDHLYYYISAYLILILDSICIPICMRFQLSFRHYESYQISANVLEARSAILYFTHLPFIHPLYYHYRKRQHSSCRTTPSEQLSSVLDYRSPLSITLFSKHYPNSSVFIPFSSDLARRPVDLSLETMSRSSRRTRKSLRTRMSTWS